MSLVHLFLLPPESVGEAESIARELSLLHQLAEAKVRRLEQIVATVAQYPSLIETRCGQAVEAVLCSAAVEEAAELRSFFEDLIDHALRTIRTTEKEAAEVAALLGRRVAGVEELAPARQRLEELKAKFIAEWPALTREEIEAQIREDGWLDAPEAFAEIAGVDVDTWKRRVEEHKQKYPNGPRRIDSGLLLFFS